MQPSERDQMQNDRPTPKIESRKVWVPAITTVVVAAVSAVAAVISAKYSARTSSEVQKMNEQLSKPEAKIVWPLMQRPAHPCEYIAGWSRNIPTDEHLFVVLPTEEDNGQRTYNYPVDVNRTQDQWSTISPVPMTTPDANYQIYLYARKDNQRLIFQGHNGLPPGPQLDNISVRRSTKTIDPSSADPCGR